MVKVMVIQILLKDRKIDETKQIKTCSKQIFDDGGLSRTCHHLIGSS